MVFTHYITNNYELHRTRSSFISPFTPDEKKQLIKKYQMFKNIQIYNGRGVRLEKIVMEEDYAHIFVSELDFYDLLVNDIIPMNLSAFKSFMLINGTQLSEGALDKLDKLHRIRDRISCFQDIYESKTLTRALALSVIVTDGSKYIIAKRNNSVAIGQNTLGISATGAIDSKDILLNDAQLESAIVREVQEELGMCVPTSSVEITGISYGCHKLQPAVTAIITVPTFKTLKSDVFNSSDFTKENSSFSMLSAEEIKTLFSKYTCTEICRHQLEELQLL